MRLAIVFLLGVGGLSCRAPEARNSMQGETVRPAPGDSVRATFDLEDVLNEQVDAWNRGDIEGFMDYYWRSEDLEFISGDTLHRGWQATLERWRVRAGRKTSSGGFELKFRRIEKRWLIVRDHTTSDDPKDTSDP